MAMVVAPAAFASFADCTMELVSPEWEMSTQTHLPFKDILNSMDQGVLARTLTFPGVWEILDVDTLEDAQLKAILIEKYNNAKA